MPNSILYMGSMPRTSRAAPAKKLSSVWGTPPSPWASSDRSKDCPNMPTSPATRTVSRSEEHTSELQSLMRNSYAVYCLKKKKKPDQRQKPAMSLRLQTDVEGSDTTPHLRAKAQHVDRLRRLM